MKHKNCTQNEKISQVTEEVLVLGVDIASEKHYVRGVDERGIELGKVLKFENNYAGFKRLRNWIMQQKEMYQKKRVIVGMEPTGHYWFNLADYIEEMNDTLEKEGGISIKLVLVNPMHVKRSKELDDGSPTKNDQKDAMVIARLVAQGRYAIPYMPKGVYAELRLVMSEYDQIIKEMNRLKIKVKRWLSIYFPEYTKVFKNPCRKWSMVILKQIPLPEEILKAGAEGINQLWRKERLSAVGMRKAHQLYMAALNSVGRKKGTGTAKRGLERLLADYEQKETQKNRESEEIAKLLKEIPYAEQLLEIKGMGLIGVAGFFSEVGDITRFQSPKQIQKLAGFSIAENSSGKHYGKTHITKRGRKKLRRILFRAVIALVANNKAFRMIHDYYTRIRKIPLKKKQSIVLLCCKLIRIIFSLVKHKQPFDGAKMLSDIKRTNQLMIA